MNKYRLLAEISRLPVESIKGNELVDGKTNLPSTLRLPLIYVDPVITIVSTLKYVLPVTDSEPVN
jgi:hypothetical protein